MPIQDANLETRFIVADATTTPDGLRQLVNLAKGKVYYVVFRFPDGHFSVVTLYEVAQAAAHLLGPSVLDRPVVDLPLAVNPAGTVDQAMISLRDARLERDRQPRRRLVVVRGDRPVGLLTNESRGGSVTGAPLDLYGWFVGTVSREELEKRLKNRVKVTTCPFCSATFAFYEVRAGSGTYACPNCHAALRP